jgi:tRNA 2-thiouridine synthesizing protein A
METLDLRGEICPFTFVRTKLRLEELAPGARLRVIVDHEPATRNIPRSLAEWGQRVVSVSPAGVGLWAIEIEKLTPTAMPPAGEADADAGARGAERRRDPRHEIRAQVQILGDEIHVTRSRNLSLSGVLLDELAAPLSTLLQPGARCQLVISAPGLSVRSPARVIRHGGADGVGMVFEDLDADGRTLLQALIVRASREAGARGKRG